jgi:hypoxanthine phosphoribosyltransferase
MHGDIEKVLLPQAEIAVRVAALAAQITSDHLATAQGEELMIVPILTGAMIFCGDLIRKIPIAMRIGLCTVSSYPGQSVRTQGSKLLSQQLGDLRGRHVLLIDDILDSGGTLRLVIPLLREMGPTSVRACVLLRKNRPEARSVTVDYVGFDIPDVFVVGYGLDYNNYYRNLPDLVTLTPQAIRAKA